MPEKYEREYRSRNHYLTSLCSRDPKIKSQTEHPEKKGLPLGPMAGVVMKPYSKELSDWLFNHFKDVEIPKWWKK